MLVEKWQCCLNARTARAVVVEQRPTAGFESRLAWLSTSVDDAAAKSDRFWAAYRPLSSEQHNDHCCDAAFNCDWR